MDQYKNVLVKLSGAAISSEQNATFDQDRLTNIAKEILSLVEMGIRVSVVIGGGNIFRGSMGDAWGLIK